MTALPSPSGIDLMVLKGGGRGPTKIGVVPLSDGAGEVEAIGEGVSRSRCVTELPVAFIRAGLADRSSPNT
jgi:NADPH:quinone reductase-like Zn-dependent oxidoreductase